jgi:hypothetical protein
MPITLPGFANANTISSLPKRLLVNIESLDKGGKTHLALTAPGPIALFDMDRGLEGVVQKFMIEKEILFTSYRHLPCVTEADHKALWGKFERDYDTALAGKGIRSIIFDTATELWEKARLAEFGRLSNVQHLYPALNAKFRKLIDRAFDAEKNLILVHKRKKAYKQNAKGEDSWTGGWERAGFTEIGYVVQVNLYSYEEGKDDAGNAVFACQVINSRLQPSLNGEIISGELCTFPYIASLLRPDTEITDWM